MGRLDGTIKIVLILPIYLNKEIKGVLFLGLRQKRYTRGPCSGITLRPSRVRCDLFRYETIIREPRKKVTTCFDIALHIVIFSCFLERGNRFDFGSLLMSWMMLVSTFSYMIMRVTDQMVV